MAEKTYILKAKTVWKSKSSNLTLWLSFETIFIYIMSLLTYKTNRYSYRDKKIPPEGKMQTAGLIFLSEYNIRSSEHDY